MYTTFVTRVTHSNDKSIEWIEVDEVCEQSCHHVILHYPNLTQLTAVLKHNEITMILDDMGITDARISPMCIPECLPEEEEKITCFKRFSKFIGKMMVKLTN